MKPKVIDILSVIKPLSKINSAMKILFCLLVLFSTNAQSHYVNSCGDSNGYLYFRHGYYDHIEQLSLTGVVNPASTVGIAFSLIAKDAISFDLILEHESTVDVPDEPYGGLNYKGFQLRLGF